MYMHVLTMEVSFSLQKVLLMLLYCWAVVDCTDCPEVCRCFLNLDSDSEQTITVDCRAQDLIRIPSPLPNATSHLDLSNNLIQSVQSGDIWAGATAIRHLQLQNNDISSIAVDALASLQELETLILYNNYQLEELQNGTFDGLGNLQRLVAYNTGIKKLTTQLFEPLVNIVELDFSFSQLQCITTGTFQDLNRLKTLTLSSNFITSVESGSFSNLPSLQYLSLNHNQIKAVPEMTFVGLDNIQTITLSGNPIDCSCSALYLYEFLLREGLSGPACEGPVEFEGRELLSLERDEFCAFPEANITPSGFIIIPSGSLLELNCVTTGTPPPEVTWSRDGMILEADGSMVIIAGASLIIANTSVLDSGQYHCSASSTAGLVSSSVQVLVVSEEESLTEAVVREDVVLECSSQVPAGVPVLWSFNDSTLAAISPKYVVLRNGSLLIQDVWVEDMGDYTCQLGQLQLVRTLVLTALPEIISINQGRCEEPLLLRIDSDRIVVLRCVAVGIPPPTVQWMMGSSVLNSSVPLMNSTEVEVTFELFRPTEMAEGNYSCIASNDVGVAMITLSVDIRVIAPVDPNVDVVELVHLAGDTALLECPLRGLELEPGYQLTWGRTSGMLPLNRINFTCDNQTLILRETVAPDDSGGYFCQVLEPSGRVFRFPILLRLCEPPVIERVCSVPVVRGFVGDDVELVCLPDPLVNAVLTWVWSVGGETLTAGDRVSFINGGERLVISALQEEDAGIYNCTVSTPMQGSIFSDMTSVELLVHRPPQFINVSSINSSVVIGDSVQLACSGDGSPTPSVTWWRLNEDMVDQVVTNGQYFVTKTSLFLTKATPLNEGLYYCNVSSVAGTLISDVFFIDVLEPPVFISFRPASTFKAGDIDARLECSGSGDPEPDIEWLRLPEGVALPAPAFPNYIRNGSDLVILEVQSEDSGLYRCSLSNMAGQVSQDVTVTVKAPPSPLVEPGDVVANMGCQVVLSCLDGGNSPLDFQWNFNGLPLPLPLEMGPQATIRPSGELVLTALQLEDSGNYSCTVFGAVGEETAVAVLTVQDPLFASGVLSAPPSIVSPTPFTQLLSMGQVAQFVCLVEGFPLPEVVWLRDGEALPNLRRYVVQDEVLTLRDVRVTDVGVYECIASNPLGEGCREFALNITAPPYIISHPLPQEVPEGGGVTLICSASGDPAPSIVWLLDGSELVSDERHYIATFPATVSTLALSNASVVEDSGTYSCLAENIAGVVQHSVEITVTPPVSAPVFVTTPSSQLVNSGDMVVLVCEVQANPLANVTWLMEGQPVPMCAEEDLLSMSSVCVLPAFSEAQQGQYSCVASNELGVAIAEVTLSLVPEEISLPSFLVSPLPQWVLNGSSFSLDCVAEGSPPPDIQWLLNMEPVNLTEGVFVQLGNGGLLVLEAAEHTVGYFTCVAEGSKVTVQVDIVDFLEDSTNTSVGGLVGPVMTSFPLGSLTMFPGQSRTLDCTASGEPPPTITWTRNGVTVVPLPTLSVASNGSLVLSAVTGTEEGNYSCIATNEGGVSVAPFQLVIEDGVIVGTGQTAPFSTLSGSSVQLDCSSAGRGVATMWLHEGGVVQESELVQVGGNGSLVISAAHMEHAGSYMCLSAGTRTWTHSAVQLLVQPREEPPYFTVEPSDVHVVKKGFLVLPCSAASSTGEHTHVHWRQADHNVSRTGPRHLVLQDNSLVMTNVRLQEAGEYSCVATNSYGHSISTATVTVSRLKVHQFVYREEGSTVILTCGPGTGEGVEWLRDDHTPLTPYNGEVWLHNVDHTHQGEYTCYHEKDRLNYFLVIQAAPTITTPPAIVMVSPGETTTLHCIATGRPRPKISWYRDGLLLETADHLSVLANGSLVLYEVEGGGVYTCRAYSNAGLDEIRILLFLT